MDRKLLEKFEENKDYMQERVNSGIEANRKGWATIAVKDEEGEVVPGAKVKLVQKTHEFKYGANLFMLDELETEEKNELYKKYFKETFNMATLPFYWKDLEPEKGKTRYDKDSPKIYRRPATDLCIEFCEENGIEPREHALAYDQFFPYWLRDKDVETCKKEYVRRCKEISERYADKIPTIEVTNELGWDNPVSALYSSPDFLEWTYKTTKRYFPANKLCINEASQIWCETTRCVDKYYMQIENTLLKGAPIDAIGMQYHIFTTPEDIYRTTRKMLDPVHLYGVLDTYSRLNKPIQITEVTIPCYTDLPEDEELQAEIIENLYSIWFSHPNVEQIIYWNLVDGYCHAWSKNPNEIRKTQGNFSCGENVHRGGLLRFDMTPKPAFLKIKELFEKRWHTETEVTANNDGVAKFRGFFGEYDVEIEANGKKVTKTLNFAKAAMHDYTITI